MKGEFNIHLEGHDLIQTEVDHLLTLTEQQNDPDFDLEKDTGLKTFNNMDKRAVEGDQHIAKSLPKMSTEDLLEMVRVQFNPGAASSTAAPENTQADEAPAEEESDDGNSSHEGLSLQERLRQVRKDKKPKQKPPTVALHSATEHGGTGCTVLELDGRAIRLRCGITEELDLLAPKVKKLWTYTI